MEQNKQIIFLYYALIETQKLLLNEVLPSAEHLGLMDVDGELYEAAERFCDALTKHLGTFRIEIAKISSQGE